MTGAENIMVIHLEIALNNIIAWFIIIYFFNKNDLFRGTQMRKKWSDYLRGVTTYKNVDINF